MYMQVVDNIAEANRYASHILEQPQALQRFDIGGARCSVCPGLSSIPAGSVSSHDNMLEEKHELSHNTKAKASASLKYRTRLKMRKQIRCLEIRWKKRRLRSKLGAR